MHIPITHMDASEMVAVKFFAIKRTYTSRVGETKHRCSCAGALGILRGFQVRHGRRDTFTRLDRDHAQFRTKGCQASRSPTRTFVPDSQDAAQMQWAKPTACSTLILNQFGRD